MAGEGDAEDRTETASAKRLQQAHERGEAPLSREAAPFAVLAAVTLLIATALPARIAPPLAALRRLMEASEQLSLDAALTLAGRATLGLLWPPLAAAALAAAIAVLGQTRMLRVSALVPDITRINPMTGLARLFGTQKLIDTLLSALKLSAMAALAWGVLHGMLPGLSALLHLSPTGLSDRLRDRVVAMAMAVLTVQFALSAVDLLRTHLRFHASMRMTRQEMKEETRESEGDPHVKGRIRQLRLQRSKRRMMAAVPSATVVVTNPTHYAVALAYERGQGGAPRIVAKGIDEVAARIREVAQEAGVPLYANPPLARALYPLKLDSEVPAEHFKAVAEIIAYVWKLRPTQRAHR